MKPAKALNVFLVSDPNLPNGEYEGRWGGYVVDVEIAGRHYRMETDVGIRTMNCPCRVKVDGENITVTSLKAGD